MTQENDFLVALARFVASNPLVVLVGFLLSVVANIIQLFTFFTYLQRRRYEAAYDEALEQWSKNVQGKYSEDQLQSLKEELQGLHIQIRNEIPRLARHSYVANQVNALEASIGDLYAQYSLLQRELEIPDRPLESNFPPQLRTLLQEKIAPAREEGLRQQRYTQTLFIILIFLVGMIALLIILQAIPADDVIRLYGPDYSIYGSDAPRFAMGTFPSRWIVGFITLVAVLFLMWFRLLWRVLERLPKPPIKRMVEQALLLGLLPIIALFFMFFLNETISGLVRECNAYGGRCPNTVFEWLPVTISVSLWLSLPIIFVLIIAKLLLRVFRRRMSKP